MPYFEYRIASCTLPPSPYSTMRLLEGEVRTDSMTVSAPGARLSTQAANFSRFRRSGASALITTASMPNCLKHSDNRILPDSLISTRATRAEAFLEGRTDEATVSNDLSIAMGICVLSLYYSGLPQTSSPRIGRTVIKGQSALLGNGPTPVCYCPDWSC